MKLFKNTGLILGGILILMISTTPHESEYIDYLQTEMSKKAEENICNEQKTVENSLANMLCNFFTNDILISMGSEMIRHSSETKNYLIFSTFTINFDDSKIIFIGALNTIINFGTFEKENTNNLNSQYGDNEFHLPSPEQFENNDLNDNPILDDNQTNTNLYPSNHQTEENNQPEPQIFVNHYEELAKNFIEFYYNNLNQENYYDSWAFLSDNFKVKNSLSYNDYEQWWKSVKKTNISNIIVHFANGEEAILEVDLSYILNNGKIINDKSPYIYIIGDEMGNWYIDKKGSQISEVF